MTGAAEVEQGADCGFPTCPAQPEKCSKYDTPFASLPAHALPASDGRATPLLVGFVAPVVALGEHDGSVYVGDLTGAVYSVKP